MVPFVFTIDQYTRLITRPIILGSKHIHKDRSTTKKKKEKKILCPPSSM